MNSLTASSEIVAWIGLDWADQEHVYRLQAAASDSVEAGVFSQKPEALHAWVARLRARFPQGQVAVALEQSRGALIYALMNYDFLLLYPVAPQVLARYRKAFCPSGAKSDPEDADLLLELLRCHRDRLRPWAPDDTLTRHLRLLVEQRRKLVDDRTRLSHRLSAWLKQAFPQALDWVGELSSPPALEFLSRWPSLVAVQQAGRSALRHFYLAHGGRDPGWVETRLAEIVNARPLTSDAAVLQVATQMTSVLVRQLRSLQPEIEELERSTQELFQQHPDHALFDSFPGAGKVFAPRLLVAFGSDRDRYADAAEMQQFSGIAPVTRRSGKIHVVHRRRARPKFLCQSFHEFAALSIAWSAWAKAYYLQQRIRGLRHHAAVRALAYKWIRILYRCWKDGTPYDERLYHEALLRRGSRISLVLESQVASAEGGRKK